jgi:hypothetical protein
MVAVLVVVFVVTVDPVDAEQTIAVSTNFGLGSDSVTL